MNTSKRTISYRKTAVIVGALFLTAMVSYLVGALLIDSIISSPDYLNNVSSNESTVIIGVLLELINVIAVIGIAVIMYPILKKFNEALALGYVAFRIIEATLLVVAVISPLLLIAISQEYLTAGAADTSYYQTLGVVFMSARAHLAGLLLTVFFSFGALILYYLLYQSKLVPRWISVWGLIAAVLVLAWNLIETFGITISAGIIFGLPIILNEILLGIWLIVRGFDSSALISESP
jgi:hypothetical protein